MLRLEPLPHRPVKRAVSGAYAEVYEGLSAGKQVVIKVARQQTQADRAATGPAFPSGGLLLATGSVSDWQPSPNEVVEAEAAVLAKLKHPNVARLVDAGMVTVEGHERAYLVTELIAGRSWRHTLAARRRPKGKQLVALVDLLIALEKEGLAFHGDLKPDNILSDAHGEVFLVDPSSGLVKLDQAGLPLRLFTTAAYNPLFEASDLPSLGVMLLEIQALQHPLVPVNEQAPSREIGPELAFWLKAQEATGRARMTRYIPWMRLPSDSDPDANRALQNVGLRCLGLELWDDGVLEIGPRFMTLAEVRQALSEATLSDG